MGNGFSMIIFINRKKNLKQKSKELCKTLITFKELLVLKSIEISFLCSKFIEYFLLQWGTM